MRPAMPLLVVLIAAMTALSPAPAAASDGRSTTIEITADLEGSPIPPTQAGHYFCHDFEFPHLRCFSTGEALDAAALQLAAASQESALAAYGPNDYVTIYSEPAFAGSYAHLSRSYDGLWVIGWNDRISSYKGRNSALGRFHVDWYAGGAHLDFCCNQSAASLSSTFTELGYSDWHVTRGAGVRVDGCVSAMIDTVNRQIRLLMALRPQVKAALYVAANRLLDECMSQEEATSLVSSVLADLDEHRGEIQSTGLVGGPLNRLDEVERHVAAGCWVYTGTGWTADGTRLFYIGGKDAR